MKLKPYKQALLTLVITLALCLPAFAQKAGATPPPPPAVEVQEVIVPEISAADEARIEADAERRAARKAKKLSKTISKTVSKSLKNLDKELERGFEELGPKLAAVFTNLNINTNYDVEIDDQRKPDLQTDRQDERVKEYSKTYPADKDDVLEINNQYGNINIKTWNRNAFKIEIRVSVSSNRDGEAQRIMDNISISDSKVGSTVSFTTRFNNVEQGGGGSWLSLSGKRSVRNSEIVYTVYMPARNGLVINSKYSSISLPDLQGKVSINNMYGRVTTGALTNQDNNINCKYTDVNVEELNGGNVTLAYGSLKMTKIGSVDANVSYAPVNIGQLKSSANVNVKYGGGLNIGELGVDLKSLNINSAYTNVNVSLNGRENFEFDVTVSYNNFNHDNSKVKVTTQTPDDDSKGFKPTKNYKGFVGRSNPNARVTITNKYQSVTIE